MAGFVVDEDEADEDEGDDNDVCFNSGLFLIYMSSVSFFNLY